MPREVSQTEEDKYHMMSVTCGIQKTKINEQTNRNKLIDTENRYGCWMGRGWRDRCKRGSG